MSAIGKEIIPERVLEMALSTWGNRSQLEMLVEECAELIQAVQKTKRIHKNAIEKREADIRLILEIADVSIMIDQMRIIYREELENAIRVKMERLSDTIYEYRKNCEVWR